MEDNFSVSGGPIKEVKKCLCKNFFLYVFRTSCNRNNERFYIFKT